MAKAKAATVRQSVAREDLPDTVRQAIDICCRVFEFLGPGYPENIYQNAFCEACVDDGLACDKEMTIPVKWKNGAEIGHVRADLVVGPREDPENRVVVEVKTLTTDIETGSGACRQYRHQVLRYRSLLGIKYGLLVNFPSADATRVQFYATDSDPRACRPRKRKADDVLVKSAPREVSNVLLMERDVELNPDDWSPFSLHP